MTSEDQRTLAGSIDADVRRLRTYCPDGALLLNALADRLPDLRAVMDAARPAGMVSLTGWFPNFAHAAGLLASLPRGSPGAAPAPPRPGVEDGRVGMPRPAPLPLRLHRAVSILSRTGDPGAPDAQAACGEVAVRVVVLEEALIALLRDAPGAADLARRVLDIG